MLAEFIERIQHFAQLCALSLRLDLDLYLLIKTYPSYLDWNSGLNASCLGGHRDLAEFMIEKGATYWNWGLQGACKGGHRDLAEWMIEKGATYWKWGLAGACIGGHRDLAELMIEKGATYCGHCDKSIESHLK